MILKLEHANNVVTVTWGDGTIHYYSTPASEHAVHNLFANFINTAGFHPCEGPAAHSTDERSFKEGYEEGWKFAGQMDKADITIKQWTGGDYTAFDEKGEITIFQGSDFHAMCDAIDNWTRASALQYESPLATLLRDRDLTIQYHDDHFKITNATGNRVAWGPYLDNVIKLALERTAP